MSNKTQQSLELAKKSIDEIQVKAVLLHQTLLNSAGELHKMLSKDISSFKELGKTTENVNKQLNNLKNTTKALTQEEARLKVEKQALNKQSKLEEQSTSKLVGAYANLIAKQKLSKKTLQDLIVSQGKNSTKTKQAQKEYDKLTAKVNQANKATSNFSKTGLGGMARGFRNLLGAFGVIGGIQLFADFAKKGFDLARKLDSLNFTMRAVIENEEVLTRTQLFLSDTAEKYGASILTLTERYNKFYTAARQSGVTLEDTEGIFKSFTKSAGFLGLRSHELEGVFLALEQMLSKGKVTTEELRRQLGERLPGAFGVMAQTVQKLNPDIEVTVATLDKMLRAGSILSAEVLPEFAKQYEKSIGIEQKERVETLNASIERMTNSWVKFVGDLTNSEGAISKVLIRTINLVGGLVDGLVLLNQTQEDFNNILENKSFANQSKRYKELGKEASDYAKISKENAEIKIKSIEKEIAFNDKLLELFKTDYPAYYKLYREHNKDTTKARQENEKLNNSLSTQKGILKAANLFTEESSKVTEKNTNNRREMADVMKEISDLQGKLKTSTTEEASGILNKISILEEELKAWKKLNNEKSKRPKAETLEDLPIKTSELSKYQKELIKVLENSKALESIPELMPLSDKTQEELKKYNKEVQELVDRLKKLNTMKGIFAEVTDTFADMFDIDISKFDFLFDGLENSVEDWAKLSKELIGSVLDASLNKYDVELQSAQRNRDLILDNELETEEKKAAARNKFDEEERRIKTERAKQERENALIKIAIDTAVGVAKVIAQTGVLSPFAIPLIVGLGLAQAGIVASQPLPQFYDGVENSNYEGLATKDERGAELQFDNKGNIKDFGQGKGAKLTHVAKGDTILTAQKTKEYLNSIANEDLQRAIFDMNMVSNGRILNENVVDKALLNEVGGLRKDIDKMGLRIQKMASRPINNNVKVEIKTDKPY